MRIKELITKMTNSGYRITKDGNVYNKYGNKLTVLCINNYPYVKLKIDGKQYKKRLDILVATLYVPNPNNYKYIKHKDGNTMSCYAKGLAWSEYNIRTLYRNYTKEKYKQHPDYPYYYFGIDGNIYRPSKRKNGKLIKLKTYDYGTYRMLSVIDKNNNRVNIRMHRIIAELFIPNPNNLPMVNHINGKKDDNRVENLEWVTASENTQHAFDTGLHRHKYLEKLSDTIKKNIIKRIMSGESNKDIGKRYDINPKEIRYIREKRKWLDVWEMVYPGIERNNIPKKRHISIHKSIIIKRKDIIRAILSGETNRSITSVYGISNEMLNSVRRKDSWKELWDLPEFKDKEIPLSVGKSDISIEYRKEVIKLILENKLNDTEIAERYGLAAVTISGIRNKTRWKEVWDKYFPDSNPYDKRYSLMKDIVDGKLTNVEIGEKYGVRPKYVSEIRGVRVHTKQWKEWFPEYYNKRITTS